MGIIRTVRVYRRAKGPRIKRNGHFDTNDTSRDVMDECKFCELRSNIQDPVGCMLPADLHPQECVVACDYKDRGRLG